jgi:hypothetical protein
VAAAPEVNPKLNAVSLQTLVVVAFVITGTGLTVTVKLKAAPTQVTVLGVTEYTTLIAAFVVFVSVPVMLDAPDPDEVPVIPATLGADQE